MDVERADHSVVGVAPDSLGKLVSRKHFICMAGKRAEKLVLRRREVQHLCSDRRDAPGVVDGKVAQALNLIAHVWLVVLGCQSATERTIDPRLQLVERKWLAEKIVRPELKTKRCVFLPLRRAANDHRCANAGFEFCAHDQSVAVGQHKIQENHIRTHLVER